LAELYLFIYFQDGGCPPSWICYLPSFRLVGSIFPENGVMIRSDLTETSQCRDVADLAGKCLLGPILGVLGILTRKIVTSSF